MQPLMIVEYSHNPAFLLLLHLYLLSHTELSVGRSPPPEHMQRRDIGPGLKWLKWILDISSHRAGRSEHFHIRSTACYGSTHTGPMTAWMTREPLAHAISDNVLGSIAIENSLGRPRLAFGSPCARQEYVKMSLFLSDLHHTIHTRRGFELNYLHGILFRTNSDDNVCGAAAASTHILCQRSPPCILRNSSCLQFHPTSLQPPLQ